MHDFVVQVRSEVEFLYFIASILLVGGVALAYRQLLLIKKDIRTRNQRAAAEKAIEACSSYFREYVGLCNEASDDRTKANLPRYAGPIGDFTMGSVPSQLRADCIRRFRLGTWVSALNHLELVAAFFVSGVADERTGFRVIGRTFCGTVEHNYDLIAFSRDKKKAAYWENTVQLYQLWRPRMTKAELDEDRQDIERRLSAISENSIDAIGADV